jgi:hypothetical protein
MTPSTRNEGVARFARYEPWGWLGGAVAWSRILGESAVAFVALQNVTVFPCGFSFQLVLQCSEESIREGMVWGDGKSHSPEFGSLTLTYPNGEIGAMGDPRIICQDPDVGRTKPLLAVYQRRGWSRSSGSRGWIDSPGWHEVTEGWASPLPRIGPLTWTLAVPSLGIAETRTEVDGGDAIDASRQARLFL